MKAEDLDWRVYHLLAGDPDISGEDLVFYADASPEEVRASLERLISANLLEKTDKGFRVLSIQEMLMRCQVKYDEKCPFIIKNGVISLKIDSGKNGSQTENE